MSPSTTNEGFQYEEAFNRGKKHVEKKDFKRAVSEFSEAITISPNKLKAYIYRGDCYMNTGRFQPAIDDFSTVIHMTPANADIYAKRAKAFEKLHKYVDAVADYGQAIDHSTTPSKSKDMHIARGRVFMAMNSLAQALDDFTISVELDPRSGVALFERAQVFAGLHKFDLALHDYDSVIGLERKSGHRDVRLESWLGRAHMLLQLADDEERTYMADAAAAESEAGVAKEDDAMAVFAVDRESALHVQHTSPNQSHAAKSYVHRAIKDVSMALQLDPESVGLLEMRGQGYLRVGDYHNALVDVNAALAKEPTSAPLLLLRAMVFKHQDALLSMVPRARAINQVTRVIELSTNAHEAYFARAQLHVENHSIEQAVEDLSAIVEMYSYALIAQSKDGDAATTSRLQPLPSSSAFSSPLVEDTTTSAVVLQSFGLSASRHLSVRQSSPTDIALRALLCRARLYMTWKGSAKVVGVKEAMTDYQRILSVAPSHLDAQMELQVAKDVEEKAQAEISAAACEWLMQHGDTSTSSSSTSASTNPNSTKDAHSSADKKKKKKKKGGAKQQTQTRPIADESGPLLSPPQPPTQSSESMQRSDSTPTVITTSTPTSSSPQPTSAPAPSVVVAKPPTPPSTRRPLPTPGQPNHPIIPMYTRDEACESMEEADGGNGLKDQRRPPSVSSNLVFHFSLTGHEDKADLSGSEPPPSPSGAATTSNPPVPVATTSPSTDVRPAAGGDLATATGLLADDTGSMDDDEPMDFHGDSKQTSPPSLSSDILLDERYFKKRKKQLEKLRQDLVDACARRQLHAINDAIVRASRKQMHDQLGDEINAAKALVELLQNQPPPSNDDNDKEVETTKVAAADSDDVDEDDAAADAATPSPLPTPRTSKEPKGAPSPQSNSAPTTPDKMIKAAASTPTNNSFKSSPVARIPQGSNDPKEADHPHVLMLQAQLEAMQLQYTRCRKELERMQATPAPTYNLSVPFAHKLQGMERCMRPLNPSILGCPALRQVDAMINQAFGPTLESERVRAKLLRYLRHILDQGQCSYSITPSGSYPLKTYLPDSDIDVCLEVPDAAATWHLAVTQALIGAATPAAVDSTFLPSSMAAPTPNLNCTVRNVTFINAEVRVVKCTIDNVSIDFTANRFGALGALALLHEMDVRVGQHHLFKRTLILIKAWAMYDSCRFMLGPPGRSNILGAVSGALSTFALNTMVMCIFNLYGKRIVHPLQGLMEFLHLFADFDWQYHAVSLFGAVPIASLNNNLNVGAGTSHANPPPHNGFLIDPDFVAQLKAKVDQVSTTRSDTKPSPLLPFQVRACNVVDPLNESNNVARSVTADNLAEMKQAFQGARQALVDVFYEAWQSAEYNRSDDVHAEDIVAHVERIDGLFANGMQMYGSGWRPDLLVHPRQLWRGPPMMLGATSADDSDVLQTEVPEDFR
ncbi:hypothetical protein DYB31_007654 [Aphanomyces astaci]|uniref:Polymerase nucleotidyl transferase domain-containing protein n=1 Tax=Aphanomyces astaci TaxID=112090 RepID=A0A397F6A3_APHAT|nr:hypothetical protein DYB31_007654 [Aphanomyces astaci]